MICVVYIFPLNGAGQFFDLAMNFINSYLQFPAGIEHKLVVVCNGSPVTDEAQCLFGEIPNCEFIEHDNSGMDIGGYEKAAREVPADFMVFFGSSAYIKRAGWLARFVQAWKNHGDTLYGTHGNRGHEAVGVMPHVRTTGFAISPALLNLYPHKATRPEHRYAWEHGPNCLCSWITRRNLTPWVVAGDGEYRMEMWDNIVGGFHNSNQQNLLCGDRLTKPPYYHCD